MTEELEVLKLVADHLDGANFHYMITGSIAANYYSVPRMTRDIDIVMKLKDRDVDRFVRLFQNDFYVDKEMIRKEVVQQGMFNLIHNQFIVKVDFIIPKESPFQNSAYSRRKKVLVESSPIWLIAAEDLILAKMLWAKDSYSEIQLNDVRGLIKTVKNLDWHYIDKWVPRLELEQLSEKVRQ